MFSAATRAETPAQVQAAGRQRASSKPPKRRSPQALAQPSLSSADRQALDFERERMRRIRLDFSLTAEDAQARLRRQIPDLSSAEFAAWDAAGLLEHRVIDGQTLYFNRAPSNLFRLSEAAVKRRSSSTPPWTDGPNGDGQRASPRSARPGAEDGQARRGASPRAGDVFADRECGCRSERRDAARLAAVSARASRVSRKTCGSLESTPARNTHRAGVGPAAHRVPRAAGRGGQADEVFDHVRADRLRPVPRRSTPPR